MKRSRCKSIKIIQKLLEYFVLEITARLAADLTGIPPDTAALFYREIPSGHLFRLEGEAPELSDGHIEMDESHFGGERQGRRGRGAAGKTAVPGILKWGSQAFNQVVNDEVLSNMTQSRKAIANKRY
jgi:transposase